MDIYLLLYKRIESSIKTEHKRIMLKGQLRKDYLTNETAMPSSVIHTLTHTYIHIYTKTLKQEKKLIQTYDIIVL